MFNLLFFMFNNEIVTFMEASIIIILLYSCYIYINTHHRFPKETLDRGLLREIEALRQPREDFF